MPINGTEMSDLFYLRKPRLNENLEIAMELPVYSK